MTFQVDRLRPVAMVFTFIASILFLNIHLAQAQIIDPDTPLGAGVVIDSQGLISVRASTEDPKLLAARSAALTKARKQGQIARDQSTLVYISLPRLFAQAKEAIDAGRELPENVRYLDGMTKLRYVFVFPEEKDLVIAGDAEPFDAGDPDRPFGLKTGRPVLRLDDLVTALRTTGPGSRATTFGCSIDMPSGALQTVKDIMEDPANRRITREKKSTVLADGVGPQAVRFFGVQSDTRFAFVCVEADYLLKRLAMGIDPTPVAAVRAVHQREKLEYSRLWFTPYYEPLLVSKDGLAFEIRGQSLQLHASGDQNSKTPAHPGTEGYAKQFTKFFPQMAAAVPAFADLWNLTDLALVGALIERDKLHVKAQWNMDWVLKKDGYPVAKVEVPREADTMANYRLGAYIIGGVVLDVTGPARERETDQEGKLDAVEARPKDDWKVVK